MQILTLTGGTNEIVFNDAPFVLNSIDYGNPSDDPVPTRTVKLTGYILAEGETEASRASYLTEKRALLCRAVMADGGFTISRGSRMIRAKAKGIPSFSGAPEFSGSDAAMFTITAEADAHFVGTSSGITYGGQTSASATYGYVNMTNPGDVPVGCVISISYNGTSLSGASVTIDGKTVTFTSSVPNNGTVTVDTRLGKKSVYTSSGVNFALITAGSKFPIIPTGASTLSWSAPSGGITSVSVTVEPEYYER